MSDYINDIPKFLEAVKNNEVFGFDLETHTPGDTPNPWNPESAILTAAVSTGTDNFGFILDHPLDATTTEEYNERLDAISVLLTDKDKLVVGHNVRTFDNVWWEIFAEEKPTANIFDTRIAHSLLDENEANTLEHLAEKYTNEIKNADKLNRKKLATYSPELVVKYNMQDAYLSWLIFEPLKYELEEEEQVVLFNFVSKAAEVTNSMTIYGATVDIEWANKHRLEYEHKAKQLKSELEALTGIKNINSTVMLGEYLYETLGLEALTKSKKTGNPSTSVKALTKLRFAYADDEELQYLFQKIVEYRKYVKVAGTYLKPFTTKHVNPDGKIHANFNISKGSLEKVKSGTVTGRLSSSSPNLQNLPSTPDVRGLIVPPSGNFRMFDADYDQVELRILAYYSQDKFMLRDFANGKDPHSSMAARMQGLDYDYVVQRHESGDPEIKLVRTKAKRVNFGVPYDIGPGGLMDQFLDSDIILTWRESADLIESWKQSVPQAAYYLDKTKRQTAKAGYLKTITGRKRRLPNALKEGYIKERALRQAVNFPIQSLAADITLAAMIKMQEFFDKNGHGYLNLSVHDSLMGVYDRTYWKEEDLKSHIERIMLDETLQLLTDTFGFDAFQIPLSVSVSMDLERWK